MFFAILTYSTQLTSHCSPHLGKFNIVNIIIAIINRCRPRHCRYYDHNSGILGIPPGNGLIPQAPLHVRALCKREHKVIDGVSREVFSDCQEQRWSSLFQALLMFVALLALEMVSWIPVGSLFGIFLYLGIVALDGNDIMERILYTTQITESRPTTPIMQNVPWRTTQFYTFIQAACGTTIFAVGHFSDVGYIFPVMVAALVPIRSYLVHALFSEEDLKFLDPHEENTQSNGADDDDDDDNVNAGGEGDDDAVRQTQHASDDLSDSDNGRVHDA